MDDKNLDTMLARRAVPEPPSNLSARISEAAKNMPQDVVWYKRISLARVVFFPVLELRTPALAFAALALLMVGAVFIGVDNGSVPEAQEDVSLAFYLDDIFYMDEI